MLADTFLSVKSANCELSSAAVIVIYQKRITMIIYEAVATYN